MAALELAKANPSSSSPSSFAQSPNCASAAGEGQRLRSSSIVMGGADEGKENTAALVVPQRRRSQTEMSISKPQPLSTNSGNLTARGVVVKARRPLWVPDSASPTCASCHTTVGFWAGNRKHHCRGCGNVFCAACSSLAAPLPALGYKKAVRVCDECHGCQAQNKDIAKRPPAPLTTNLRIAIR